MFPRDGETFCLFVLKMMSYCLLLYFLGSPVAARYGPFWGSNFNLAILLGLLGLEYAWRKKKGKL